MLTHDKELKDRAVDGYSLIHAKCNDITRDYIADMRKASKTFTVKFTKVLEDSEKHMYP